ncbi:hypothetical protein SSX86_014690 [Deinandra increscens subsp. villosa]|uniref:Sister chromatid cohesion 1 protein 2 n=1 Tax=Deinandra increscens subsp. villosa TaxID=3103831 RepID=A0AAP0GXV1_9ASTR
MISAQLSMGKKKGDLGHVWMAAHFPKRIKKELVEQTNITSSVDKILVEQLPVVTYRILGYLLLGVARIYSKKVEYLLFDCNHSMNEMKFLSEGRKKVDTNFGGMCLPESSSQRSKLKVADLNPSESSRRQNSSSFVEAMRPQFSSISLPDHFELDAFDLEVHQDDSSNDHVTPHLELVLHDAWENYPTERHTFGKDHASASTSAMITSINPETSAEKFRHRFSLEDRLDPMVLDESDEELVPDSLPLLELPEWNNHTDSPGTKSVSVKSPDKHPEEECPTTGQTVVSEMTSVDTITLKPSPNKSKLSVTIDVTPQSKVTVVSGERKSEPVTVRTPACREHARAPRKRKCVYDDPIVVPNGVYGTWVSNASDLVRKRRTPTPNQEKERRSFDYLLQPIILGFPSDLRSAISTKPLVRVEVEEMVNTSISKTDELGKFVEVEETADTPISKTDELGKLNLHKLYEKTEAEVIAPLTPATQSTSMRFNEIHETSRVNQVEPTSSCESREKVIFPIRDVDLDVIQREEGPSSLGEDNQESVPVAEKWSAVTKSVAGYLHSNFVNRKEKEEEAINLSQILKQKTKKESARFFYQTLVLKTGGYIDVKQEKPYGEIYVKQTSKLKGVFGGCS